METDISPLAKRLAEENNVNWHSLAGSGSSGRVVERDVLEYLARVMAGDEDLNPTAEPVPEGMEAWPEEDVQGHAATATAPSEVDEDDGMFDDEPSGTMPSVSATRNDGSSNTLEEPEEAIDEDIFLFDDDDEGEPEQNAYAETFDTPSEPAIEAADLDESDLDNLDDAFAVADDEALEADESDLFAQTSAEADSAEPDLFSPEEPVEVEEDVSLFVGEAVAPDDEPATDMAADDMTDAFAVEEDAEVTSDPAQDASEPEAVEETTFADPVTDEVDATFAESSTESDVASEVAPNVAATDTASLPLVSYGVLLRRRVDLGELTGAQVAIGQELGQDPVAPTSLLLRAAAKSALEHQLGTAGIGLVTLGKSASISAIEAADTMTFGDLVTHISEEQATLSEDADHRDDVGLAVADLSHLKIDEAVLNLGVPVLTLGRILKDDAGTYSTLTLSGDIEVETGTQLLASVAELLASPIRLVM